MYSPLAVEELSVADLVVAASSAPLIDDRSESLLAERFRTGNAAALETLVRCNLRIAVDEAIRNRGLGTSQAELVRAGTRALVESARSFDPKRHESFAGHARAAVRHAITRRLSAS